MGCTLWSNVASWDVPELNGRCFHFYDYQEGNHQQSWFQPEQTAVSSKIDGSALKDRDEAPRSLGWTPRIMSNTIKDMDINQPCWAKTSVFLGVVQLRCTMLYTPIPNICPCAATFWDLLRICSVFWQTHVVDVQYLMGWFHKIVLKKRLCPVTFWLVIYHSGPCGPCGFSLSPTSNDDMVIIFPSRTWSFLAGMISTSVNQWDWLQLLVTLLSI